MYCRWENGLHPRESLFDLATAYKDHILSLNDHIKLLKSRIKHVEGESDTHVNGNTEIPKDDNRLNYDKDVIEQVYT